MKNKGTWKGTWPQDCDLWLVVTERKAVGLEVQEQMVVTGAARAQPSPYRNQGPLWSENSAVRNGVTCLETEQERTGMYTNQAVRTYSRQTDKQRAGLHTKG